MNGAVGFTLRLLSPEVLRHACCLPAPCLLTTRSQLAMFFQNGEGDGSLLELFEEDQAVESSSCSLSLSRKFNFFPCIIQHSQEIAHTTNSIPYFLASFAFSPTLELHGIFALLSCVS